MSVRHCLTTIRTKPPNGWWSFSLFAKDLKTKETQATRLKLFIFSVFLDLFRLCLLQPIETVRWCVPIRPFEMLLLISSGRARLIFGIRSSDLPSFCQPGSLERFVDAFAFREPIFLETKFRTASISVLAFWRNVFEILRLQSLKFG